MATISSKGPKTAAAGVEKKTAAAEPTWGAKLAEGIRTQVVEWTVNIIVLLFAWTSIVQAFVVPTESMETTILRGDHLFVDKMAFAPKGSIASLFLPYTDVKRGDVICFAYPVDPAQTYVKRVIGVPGDHIHIVDRQVFVNGKAAVEPYKQHIRGFAAPYFDTFPDAPPSYIEERGREFLAKYAKDGELVIPEGFYYAMGDNRDNSADSRWWGLVPRANIMGKPVLIWWSYDAPTEALATAVPTPSHLLDLVLNFPSKTRWDRTFRMIRGRDPIESAK